MGSPLVFLDWPLGVGELTMLTYYNDSFMKQGACSTFCTGALMVRCDSALLQKAGAAPCPVSTSFVLAPGRLQNSLPADYLLCKTAPVC